MFFQLLPPSPTCRRRRPGGTLPVVVLAGADPDQVGVIGGDGDVADRARALAVEDRGEGGPHVLGLPEAAGGGGDVEDGGVPLEDGEVVDPPGHGGGPMPRNFRLSKVWPPGGSAAGRPVLRRRRGFQRGGAWGLSGKGEVPDVVQVLPQLARKSDGRSRPAPRPAPGGSCVEVDAAYSVTTQWTWPRVVTTPAPCFSSVVIRETVPPAAVAGGR